MHTRFATLVLCILCSMPQAQAQMPLDDLSLSNPLIADVSQTTIDIRSDFKGAPLLIFGARNMPGELVIAVRGPKNRATLRRKERIAGMWMHVDTRHYEHLPSFYAIASSRPLNRVAPPALLRQLGLGERRIIETSNPEADERFDTAISEIMIDKRWWQPAFGRIDFFNESLFKARIDLPDTLPSGNYTAEVYLFHRGRLSGTQTIPITVAKVGFDAQVAQAAQSQGLLYGLLAVALALCGGWLGHRIFQNRR
jgi:uncharacterized protein (TIGR02186 family)